MQHDCERCGTLGEHDMDWGYKAVLTAITVALVLLVAQALGRRLAGLLAGLPIVTAPALLWIASDQGAAFAARAAVGSIAASGLMALFALAYERLSRHWGPWRTLAASLTAAAGAAVPMALLAGHPLRAVLVTAALCAVAVLLLPAGGPRSVQVSRGRGELLATALVAGAVSVLASVIAREIGAFWAGLFAALPIISGAALLHQHLTASHQDIQRFLRGYVAGLFGNALFALAFAATAVQLGATAALAGALAFGLAATVGLVRTLDWMELRPLPARPSAR